MYSLKRYDKHNTDKGYLLQFTTVAKIIVATLIIRSFIHDLLFRGLSLNTVYSEQRSQVKRDVKAIG